MDSSADRELTEELAKLVSAGDSAMAEYLCYILLDFAVIDPELEDVPLAAALDWSQRIEMADQFEKLALKELGIGKKQLNKLKKDAGKLIERAASNV